MPPGQIWSIVEGASDADIAQAIYEHTSAGIGWYGTVTEPYTDPDSLDPYDIKFSRPTYEDIYISMGLSKNPEYGEYPGDGDDQIKQNILDYFDEFQKLSIDVSRSRLITPINQVPGHTIDYLYIGLSPSPTGEDDIVIALNEKAITDETDITIEF